MFTPSLVVAVSDSRLHHSRHLTSYTRTGSSKPFATNSPRSANRKPLPEHNPRTVSATSISPPSAFAAIRDARITVAPKRSPSSSIGSPALRPTRTRQRLALALGEGALQGDGALDGFGDAAERGHEAVAHRLDLGAAVRLQHFARDPLVLAEDGAAAFVAEAGHHLGVADEVGEEDGAEGGSPPGPPLAGSAVAAAESVPMHHATRRPTKHRISALELQYSR